MKNKSVSVIGGLASRRQPVHGSFGQTRARGRGMSRSSVNRPDCVVNSQPAIPDAEPTVHGSPSQYALRKGLGIWELVFNGHRALLKHEQGVYYVAWLLTHPPSDPIHGLELATRALAFYSDSPAATTLIDPRTATTVVVPRDATIQQRNLALDDDEAAAALRRTEHTLEAIADDEGTSEPVKAEVLRELEEIYAFREKHAAQVADCAHKAVRTVRMGIRRLHRHLAEAVTADGNPHPVLRAFGAHLEQHLIFPSARYSSPRAGRVHVRLAGCFTYEPPAGISWAS